MRAGPLRHMITLQRQDNAPRNNYGEKPANWADLGLVRASIDPIKGSEKTSASGENAQLTHRIRVRYSGLIEMLRPRDRVLYGSRVFDLQSIAVTDMGNRQAELLAVERIRD